MGVQFLQTDPTGYKDGLNWYAYVGNDPLNKGDPTGREQAKDWPGPEMAKGAIKPEPNLRGPIGIEPTKKSDDQAASSNASVDYKPSVRGVTPEVSNMVQCTSNCLGGETVRVTSAADSHDAGTPHMRGEAADITVPGMPHNSGNASNIMQCMANCGAVFQIDEYAHPSAHATGGHYHGQTGPGRGGAVGPKTKDDNK